MVRARGVAAPLAVALALAVVPLTATPAQAAAPGLAITAPTTASLGAMPVGGGTLTASLGTVRVSTSSLLAHDASWTATVSTSGFTTGGATAAERVDPGQVRYLSGLATAQTGLAVGACLPGQALTPVALSAPRTAFGCSGLSLLSSTSLSWNPQLTIETGAGNVAGAYTGTVTHSVA